MEKFIRIFKNDTKILAGFTLREMGNFSHTRISKYNGNTTFENKKELSKINKNKNLNIFSPFQTHSDIVIKVEDKNKNFGFIDKETAIEGDSCWTVLTNTMLLTTFADCVPILIYEKNKKMISSVHSGWKGTKQRIIKKTIEELLNNGARKEFLFFVIGPSIKKCCYEVGDEFLDFFKDYKDSFEKRNDKLYFDNSNVVKKQIIECGISEENIEILNFCTCCNIDPKFWSYRRDKENFEGHAAFIAIID